MKEKEVKMIFCSNCGRKFAPVGREHICPACKQAAAENAKRAAVERAKARSYSGEACPVRISAKARGFIEAVAQAQGTKFIPALDEVLKKVAADYGFTDWQEVPEHKTARRAAKVTETVTPAAPATPVKPASASKASKASKASASKASTPNTPSKATEPVKTTSKTSKGEKKA